MEISWRKHMRLINGAPVEKVHVGRSEKQPKRPSFHGIAAAATFERLSLSRLRHHSTQNTADAFSERLSPTALNEIVMYMSVHTVTYLHDICDEVGSQV